MGFWRFTGSTWLQNLAVRNIIVFNSMPGGLKLVGIHNRMAHLGLAGKGIEGGAMRSLSCT
eukprot:685201-Pelagomonas_calceolata.AAC.1